MKKLFAILSLILMSSVVFTGCLQKTEKEKFIDATVEATCLVFQADTILDPALEEQVKAIYNDYGFDANDDAAMEVLTTRYENDVDVRAAITTALEECAGDLMSGLEELPAVIVEDAVVEDAVE